MAVTIEWMLHDRLASSDVDEQAGVNDADDATSCASPLTCPIYLCNFETGN